MTNDTAPIRDLIKQVLFTAPGERPDQPDFGVGLQHYVFEPDTPETRATLQQTIRHSLGRWLSELIVVDKVQVKREASSLNVTVQYKVCRTNQRRCDVFSQEF